MIVDATKPNEKSAHNASDDSHPAAKVESKFSSSPAGDANKKSDCADKAGAQAADKKNYSSGSQSDASKRN